MCRLQSAGLERLPQSVYFDQLHRNTGCLKFSFRCGVGKRQQSLIRRYLLHQRSVADPIIQTSLPQPLS